jgi:hypothetical protein
MKPNLVGLLLTRTMRTVTFILWLVWTFVTFQYFGVLFFMTREVSVCGEQGESDLLQEEHSYCPSSVNITNPEVINTTMNGDLPCLDISNRMFSNLLISCLGDFAGKHQKLRSAIVGRCFYGMSVFNIF